MTRPLALLPAALLLFACGGETSVASRSAAAYRDAQAKGIEISGGHEHAGHESSASTSSAAEHATSDPHAGHVMGAAASVSATSDPHAGHAMGTRAASSATSDPHAGHAMGARAASPAPADAHAGHTAAAGAPAQDAIPTMGAPNTSAEMRQLRPAATLQGDPFDAPVPVSVSEAARASGAEPSHEGHKP